MAKANLYFMTGEDRFSLLQELKRWKTAFIEKCGDTDLEELDGETSKIEQIINSIVAVPFLSEKRLVILKNFLSGHKADEANALLSAIEKLPESTVLLIAEFSEPDKRTSIFKALSSQASPRLFLRPKGVQLNQWILRRAQAEGASMQTETAAYLASTAGEDLFALNNEIQKLCLFAKGGIITREMVDELVTSNAEKSIFLLTDQLAQKNLSGALETLRGLNEQDEDPAFIFAMIVRQFRLILEMKALSEQNLTPTMMARKMAVHPFVISSSLRFTKNFTFEQLRRKMASFMELDHRLKTGGIPLKPRAEDQYLLALERILLK